jgi:hypothetical protein
MSSGIKMSTFFGDVADNGVVGEGDGVDSLVDGTGVLCGVRRGVVATTSNTGNSEIVPLFA